MMVFNGSFFRKVMATNTSKDNNWRINRSLLWSVFSLGIKFGCQLFLAKVSYFKLGLDIFQKFAKLKA